MKDKLISFMENSQFSSLIKDNEVTDISYNGQFIFYMHNTFGRLKADFKITSSEAVDFIRQIANLSEKQFSYVEPILDVSFGRFRVNAVHHSIGRINDDNTITFSIRIASYENRIEKDNSFFKKNSKDFLFDILSKKESLVIAGETGCGKTELQKYLISHLKKNSRIVVIDNLQELECLRANEDLDITSWQISDSKNKTFEDLIRNALRSNPDWLIISESRGREMSDILLSVMSGHPIITTLHANSIYDIPYRMVRMVQLANQNQLYDDVLKDISHHIQNYVFLKRKIDKNGHVVRYISEIGRLNVKTRQIDLVYQGGN